MLVSAERSKRVACRRGGCGMASGWASGCQAEHLCRAARGRRGRSSMRQSNCAKAAEQATHEARMLLLCQPHAKHAGPWPCTRWVREEGRGRARGRARHRGGVGGGGRGSSTPNHTSESADRAEGLDFESEKRRELTKMGDTQSSQASQEFEPVRSASHTACNGGTVGRK
jgi:hypothetical protein